MSNWIFEEKEVNEFDNIYVGFVYIITNKISNKKYIGKKLFKFSKSKVVTVVLKNGTKKKKKIRYKDDSDWLTYYGSNKELKDDVLNLGEENFTREIIKLCKSKGECSYYEAKYQFDHNVLLRKDEFYNSWISCKIHSNHLKNLGSS